MTDQEPKSNNGKVWAAGFYAGREFERKNVGELMSSKQLESKKQSLNGYELKTFNAVPINESWTIQRIHSELARLNHTNGDYTSTARCVHHLVEIGLVRKVDAKRFTQTASRENDVDDADSSTAPAATPESKALTPLQAICQIAEQYKQQAASLLAITQQLEEHIIALDDQLKGRDAETAKLKQLAKMLRELGEVSAQ